jgi:hypothetical protein
MYNFLFSLPIALSFPIHISSANPQIFSSAHYHILTLSMSTINCQLSID